MANAPGWEQGPEHVPHLQRALSAATADIDAVEDRLAELFERSGDDRMAGAPPPRQAPRPAAPSDAADEPGEDVTDAAGPPDPETDAAFAALDAALTSEEPDEPDRAGRTLFRRRT